MGRWKLEVPQPLILPSSQLLINNTAAVSIKSNLRNLRNRSTERSRRSLWLLCLADLYGNLFWLYCFFLLQGNF